jgi:signal peptidase II
MNDQARARRGSLGLPLAVAAAVLLVDQLTKRWAVSELTDRNIDLWWTLRFNLSYNSGMAFGRGEGFGPIIGVVALVVVCGFLLTLRRQGDRLSNVAAGLVIGGALGNVADRLFRSPGWFRGGVVDFIDAQWWPIFNVADIAITVGGVLLVVASVRRPRVVASDVHA